MSTSFNPVASFIPVIVRLYGPLNDVRVRLALDTGATQTLVNKETAQFLGYDVDEPAETVGLITASGEETTSVIAIRRIEALEQSRRDLPVLCHNLPSGAPFDGLLGLDFFRGQCLTIDFREGLINLD
ncbi:MAG: retropepsin-like aspartic protease [Chloroflexi bacterium]|nr:retropepsin-like aspartic protease [Chloroflexota bacterium]